MGFRFSGSQLLKGKKVMDIPEVLPSEKWPLPMRAVLQKKDHQSWPVPATGIAIYDGTGSG